MKWKYFCRVRNSNNLEVLIPSIDEYARYNFHPSRWAACYALRIIKIPLKILFCFFGRAILYIRFTLRMSIFSSCAAGRHCSVTDRHYKILYYSIKGYNIIIIKYNVIIIIRLAARSLETIGRRRTSFGGFRIRLSGILLYHHVVPVFRPLPDFPDSII